MSRAAEFLLSQFNVRKKKNPRYSQRAFARLIEVNPGRVNQYFSGERPITKTAAQRISSKLNLDAEQEAYFVYLCEFDRSEKKNPKPRLLKDDELALMVEWHHFAILSLISTKDFRMDPEWIAARLSLPVSMVISSLERLQRIGMIENVEGVLERKAISLATSSDIPNQFLVLSHQDSLRYIVDHLPQVPVEKRDVSSVTLPIDERKLKEAKELIRTFRRRLATFLVKGKSNQVYTLNIQLFPFTKDVPS